MSNQVNWTNTLSIVHKGGSSTWWNGILTCVSSSRDCFSNSSRRKTTHRHDKKKLLGPWNSTSFELKGHWKLKCGERLCKSPSLALSSSLVLKNWSISVLLINYQILFVINYRLDFLFVLLCSQMNCDFFCDFWQNVETTNRLVPTTSSSLNCKHTFNW